MSELSRFGPLWDDIRKVRAQLIGLMGELQVASGRCPHYRVVAVESVVTGELLAGLCADCDEQVSAVYVSTFLQVARMPPALTR